MANPAKKTKKTKQSLSSPRFSKPILIIFAIVFAAIGGYAIYRSFAAGGTTYYISATGSDSNNGTSQSTPWKTIGKVNSATEVSGDNVLFNGGDTFNDTYLAAKSGVSYSSYGNGKAILGYNPAGGIYLSGVHDVVIDNLTIDSKNGVSEVYSGISSDTANPSTRITVSNCLIQNWHIGINVAWPDSFWTIQNTTITSIGGSGIIFNRDTNGVEPPAGQQTNNQVLNSTITNTGLDPFSGDGVAVHGIYDDSLNSTISGNTITGFEAAGVSVRFKNSTVTNNTIDGAGRGEIGITFFEYDPTGGSSVWSYNRIQGVSTAGIYIADGGSGVSSIPDTLENFTLANNTISLSTSGSQSITADGLDGYLHLANNIVGGASSYGLILRAAPGGGFTENHDLWYSTNTLNYAYLGIAYTTLASYQSASGQGGGDKATNPLLNSDLTLQSGSPAIDGGTISVNGLTYAATCDGAVYHYCDSAPDMGAMEFNSGGTGGTGGTVPGDTNGDGVVNLTDLTNLLANWNTNNAATDFNHDSIVNGVDLSILLSHYGGSGPTSIQIPANIASDCSVDVTSQILSWISTVPDNSVLQFGTNKCYRVEGTIQLTGRTGLDFEGNGSTFKALNAPADQTAMWRIFDSTNIKLANMTMIGGYTSPGTFTASLQHAHAVDLRGTSAELATLNISNFAGDCVYYGLGSNGSTRASGSFHDSTCTGTGRNGVSLVAADNVLVQRVNTNTIGYETFDVEPNVGAGFGDCNDRFDSNTINNFAQHAFSIVESAPICNQSFTNNHIIGPKGLKIAIGDPLAAGFRPNNVTITGNTADNPATPTPINADNVDILNITGNTVPMTAAGYMAAVTGSCKVTVSGNSYPGGGDELYQATPTTGC